VNILPASDIIEDGLNRFFVSEYFRTFFAGDSQTAQIIASLNRFFVSEYFRTGESGLFRYWAASSQSLLRQRILPDWRAGRDRMLTSRAVSIASSSANTSDEIGDS